MKTTISKPKIKIEIANLYNALTGWKSKLSGGHKGILYTKISKEEIKKIKSMEKEEAEKILKKYVYINKEKEKISRENLKTELKKHLNEFTKKFEEITETKINKIKCYIISCVGWGSYNIKKQEIYIHYDMPLFYTFAHELFHLYFYKALEKSNYDKIKVWKLSETLVNIVLFDKELKKFWPKKKASYYNIKIENIQLAKKLWKNKKSFHTFIENYFSS